MSICYRSLIQQSRGVPSRRTQRVIQRHCRVKNKLCWKTVRPERTKGLLTQTQEKGLRIPPWPSTRHNTNDIIYVPPLARHGEQIGGGGPSHKQCTPFKSCDFQVFGTAVQVAPAKRSYCLWTGMRHSRAIKAREDDRRSMSDVRQMPTCGGRRTDATMIYPFSSSVVPRG